MRFTGMRAALCLHEPVMYAKSDLCLPKAIDLQGIVCFMKYAAMILAGKGDMSESNKAYGLGM